MDSKQKIHNETKEQMWQHRSCKNQSCEHLIWHLSNKFPKSSKQAASKPSALGELKTEPTCMPPALRN